jgi:hypothetical protein
MDSCSNNPGLKDLLKSIKLQRPCNLKSLVCELLVDSGSARR